MDLTAYPALAGETSRKVCLFYRKEQFLSKSEQSFIRCAVEATKVNKATIATYTTTVDRGDANDYDKSCIMDAEGYTERPSLL